MEKTTEMEVNVNVVIKHLNGSHPHRLGNINSSDPTRLPTHVAWWGNRTSARRVKENVVLDRHKQVTGCQRWGVLFCTARLNQPIESKRPMHWHAFINYFLRRET